MNQIFYPYDFAVNARASVVQKRTLENHDLRVVCNLVCEGLREGLYADIVPGKKRCDVIRFLRHLVTRCEIRRYDRFGKCVGNQVAALWVYTANGDVIGFSVLAEPFYRSLQSGFYFTSKFDLPVGTDADHLPIVPKHRFRCNDRTSHLSWLPDRTSEKESKTGTENSIEVLMLSVTRLQRGLGYGAAILDSLIHEISHRHFDLLVRCSSDMPLLFAMLATRGFSVVGRYCQCRVLRFVPPLASDKALLRDPKVSRCCE
jgi:hypothetical protein